MQVEAERDEGLREYDQLLSSFTTRCGQIQEQEQLHVQQLWKENEALANQLSAAQEEINSRSEWMLVLIFVMGAIDKSQICGIFSG